MGFLLFALCFLTIAGCKSTEEHSRLNQKAAEKVAMHNPKVSKWMNHHHPRNGTTYLLTGQNNQNSEDFYTKSTTSNDHHWKITYTSKTEISPNQMEVTVNSITGEIESIQVSDVIAGIDWAVQNDIDIINLSFGSDTPSNMLKAVLDMAYSKGILIVASAGNEGYEPYNSTVGYRCV